MDFSSVTSSPTEDNQDPWWLPTPQHWRLDAEQGFDLNRVTDLALLTGDASVRFAAERFAHRVGREYGMIWTVVATANPGNVTIGWNPTAHPEGYRMETGPQGIQIEGDGPGIFHALTTLWQLVHRYGTKLPGFVIEDWPQFSVRGVMLDVSRSKIPTLKTLLRWVDRLADWKLNHVELYMENAFAYPHQAQTWEPGSRLTAEEMIELDQFCRDRHIDLVPNQNSFGHLTSWLTLPAYREFAECPGGADFPDGHFDYPWALDPNNPKTFTFLQSLYDGLLPNFSSPYFNVGCDETFDLGQGQSRETVERKGRGTVYLEFLRRVVDLVGDHQKTALYWADMISRHHPDRINDLPNEAIALEWGYSYDYPFDSQVAPLAEAGKRFITCPSTGTWLSLLGRSQQMLENTQRAAEAALRYGGLGIITTEWGDWGHFQPLTVADLGVAAAAAVAWNPRVGVGDRFLRAVSWHRFGDQTGEVGCALWNLGKIHAEVAGTIDAERRYFAPLVEVLFRPWRWDDLKSQFSLERLDRARQMMQSELAVVESASMAELEAVRIRKEFQLLGNLMTLAMEIVVRLLQNVPEPWPDLAERLTEVLATHRLLWREENREGGLEQSVAYLAPLGERLGVGPSCRFTSLQPKAGGPQLFRYPL